MKRKKTLNLLTVLGRTDDDFGDKPNPVLNKLCDKSLLYFQLTYNFSVKQKIIIMNNEKKENKITNEPTPLLVTDFGLYTKNVHSNKEIKLVLCDHVGDATWPRGRDNLSDFFFLFLLTNIAKYKFYTRRKHIDRNKSKVN